MKACLLTALLLALVGADLALAQTPTADQKAESDRVLRKIRQMEMYNQILPVLMSKDQIKALLPILEKHRADADKYTLDEHRMLLGLEKELDKAIAEARDKGILPGEKIMRDSTIHFQAFLIRRKALIDDTVMQLKATMKQKLNAGQVRAAAHSFNPTFFGVEPKDGEELTEDDRLDFWVRMVLMDNETYPILLGLSK